MSFEEKYEEQTAEVVSMLNNYQRGMTVPWSVIENIMKRSRKDVGGWRIIVRARNILLRDWKIITRAEMNEGIRLLTDKEAVREVFQDRQKKITRQESKCKNELEAIRDEELSDKERYAKVRQIQFTEEKRKEAKRARRGFKMVEVNPIKPRNVILR